MFHVAWELGPRRIRVNMVVPVVDVGAGGAGVRARQAERRGVSEDEVTAPISAQMPLGEIPTVEDVADAALFLCSDRARMITGQTLYVNAGELHDMSRTVLITGATRGVGRGIADAFAAARRSPRARRPQHRRAPEQGRAAGNARDPSPPSCVRSAAPTC